MVKCPKCCSEDIECDDIVDVVDQVDEDGEFKYYTALYRNICLSCGKIFTTEGNYKERKW